MTFKISNDMDRCVFRSFAMVHPDEAAQMNWPEFVAMAKALNPEITEEALRKILEKNSGKPHER